jgi:hypothetical protein
LSSGLWRHRDGAVEPLLRLPKVRYDDNGKMVYPRLTSSAPESALKRYLDEAAKLFESAAAAPSTGESTTTLRTGLEQLRWFDLPAVCLAD